MRLKTKARILGLLLFSWSFTSLNALDPSPPEGMGVLEITNRVGDLVVEVGNRKNQVFRPLDQDRYLLPLGEYTVRVRLADDIAWLWSWSTTVEVTGGSPSVIAIPESARVHTPTWELEHEKLTNLSLNQEYLTARAKVRVSREIAGWGLTLGTTALMAAGAFYATGAGTRKSYDDASGESAAQSLHIQLASESVGFVLSASFAVISWGIGLFCLVDSPSPSPEKVQVLVQESSRRLLTLQESAPPSGASP